MPWCLTIQWFTSDTNGSTITAASSAWFRLASVSPMSCTSAHTTYSSSRAVRAGGGLQAVGEPVDRIPARVTGEQGEVAEDPIGQSLREAERVPGDDGVVFARGVHHAREGGLEPVVGGHARHILHPMSC